MKKFIAIALLAFTTACAQAENTGMMDKGMMCEKFPCCQKMMEGMKSGMQCPMMKGDKKDDMQCSCCQGMMQNKAAKSQPKQSLPKFTSAQDEHSQHH
jgi:hypothetical protein